MNISVYLLLLVKFPLFTLGAPVSLPSSSFREQPFNTGGVGGGELFSDPEGGRLIYTYKLIKAIPLKHL